MGVRHVPSDFALDDSWLLVCLNTPVSSDINTCFIIILSFACPFFSPLSILFPSSSFGVSSVQREKEFACNYPLEGQT